MQCVYKLNSRMQHALFLIVLLFLCLCLNFDVCVCLGAVVGVTARVCHFLFKFLPSSLHLWKMCIQKQCSAGQHYQEGMIVMAMKKVCIFVFSFQAFWFEV